MTVPSVADQTRIVAHMTDELARYDELMSEATSQLAMLQERRQALITHAVTQGIDGLPGVA